MEHHQQYSSKQHQQRPTRLHLAVNASPFPHPNWSLDEWHLQQHPLHHAAISSSPNSGHAVDISNLDEMMWHQAALPSPKEAEYATGPFPERPGEPDCAFYMRTGHCGYGMGCRYNHPPNRLLAAGGWGRDQGDYPERIGQPECQYYMKTGTCKFGTTCKFHHPKDRAGLIGRPPMNVLGFPMRMGEKDCAYYMRTATCKFGVTCKFNHPQPATLRAPVGMSGSSMYASNDGSSAMASPHSFQTGLSSWSTPRAPYMQRSQFQGPSNFAPLIVQPQNLVSAPGWRTFQARMGSQQPLGGTGFIYGAGTVKEASTGNTSAYGSYVPGSAAAVHSTIMLGDSVGMFPERPGQPECQYYMRTGDCKFGMSCRYHHPSDRASMVPTCSLGPSGLPLRPGVNPCAFYMQYGTCKFGYTCKFDHPLQSTSGLTYSPSASSLAEMPIAPCPPPAMGSSVHTPMPPTDATISEGPKVPRERVLDKHYENLHPGSNAVESTESSHVRSGSGGSSSSGSSRGAEPVEFKGDSSEDGVHAS